MGEGVMLAMVTYKGIDIRDSRCQIFHCLRSELKIWKGRKLEWIL